MKYLAYFCLFYSAKQIAHIWAAYSGHFNVWLSLLYAAVLAGIIAFPFRKEFKLIWLTLLTLDAISPLIPYHAVRIVGLIVSTLWLSTFLWRRFVQKEGMSPWADRQAQKGNGSRKRGSPDNQ